jgi:NAD(P)-dependent dehydrogenase (short-subunit alcohol dehydrogenase family)
MADMSGKTCLVTGATDGIGKQAALELAKMHARVIVVGRDPQKGAAVVEELRAASGNAQVELAVADLSSQAAVRALAAEVKRRTARLDVLINNAGGLFTERRETVDGIEWTFALNHLAYYLLARELEDLLRASAPARIVNVSSGAHTAGKIHWDDPGLARGYRAFKAYCQSKLANLLFTRELARRLDGSGVAVNAIHPGPVASKFGHNNGVLFRLAVRIAQTVMISAAQGADTLVWAATAPELAGVTGKYFYKRRETAPSPRATDDESARRLWDASAKMVGLAA